MRENRMERLCKGEVVMGKMAEDKGVAVCLLQSQILRAVISLNFFPISLKTVCFDRTLLIDTFVL